MRDSESEMVWMVYDEEGNEVESFPTEGEARQFARSRSRNWSYDLVDKGPEQE